MPEQAVSFSPVVNYFRCSNTSLPLVTGYPYDGGHGMGGIELRARRIGAPPLCRSSFARLEGAAYFL